MEFDFRKIADSFSELKPKYEKLGKNIIQAIEIFLDESNISFLSINYRVKDIDFISRKN